MKRNSPIGIFDSGIGGLTVLEQVSRELPGESLVYFGDTARVPYGTKSTAVVRRFSMQIVNFLMRKKVKMVVVACNTSSAQALPQIKAKLKGIPVIGVVEPGAKYAVAATRRNRIGVIGTQGTIKSGGYSKAIKKLNGSIKVFSAPCPLFVPLAEEGWFTGHRNIVRQVAREYLHSLRGRRIDTLVLGCTHYPLLKGIIREVMGNAVKIIDSAESTARETKRLLGEKGIPAGRRKPSYRYYVSDEPEKFTELAGKFISKGSSILPSMKNTRKINIEEY